MRVGNGRPLKHGYIYREVGVLGLDCALDVRDSLKPLGTPWYARERGEGAPLPFQVKVAGAIDLRYTHPRNRPASGLSAVASSYRPRFSKESLVPASEF